VAPGAAAGRLPHDHGCRRPAPLPGARGGRLRGGSDRAVPDDDRPRGRGGGRGSLVGQGVAGPDPGRGAGRTRRRGSRERIVTTAPRGFSQVDVCSAHGLRGNPLAVVHDADGLDEETLAQFARWTNLSETTFLLPPTDPAADYRVRIFTTGGELPFAGHPPLGTCHVWRDAGGRPQGEQVVQECGVGLVRIREDGSRLAFAAPPLVRSGPVAPDLVS